MNVILEVEFIQSIIMYICMYEVEDYIYIYILCIDLVGEFLSS